MKGKIIFLFSLCGGSLLSFSPANVHGWSLTRGDNILIKNFWSDTLLQLEPGDDTLRFQYCTCRFGDELTTRLYLDNANGKRTLVSEEKSSSCMSGSIPVATIKKLQATADDASVKLFMQDRIEGGEWDEPRYRVRLRVK